MDFLWELQQRAEELARLKIKLAWSLRQGVEVYYNPDFICPHCKGGLPTKRLYIVDSIKISILGCWYIDDPVMVNGLPQLRPVGNDGLKEVVHPHASDLGDICMGDALTAHQALFNGIVPGKHFYHTDIWLLNVGHDCPKMPKYLCIVCSKKFCQGYALFYGKAPICSTECNSIASNTLCCRCCRSLDPNRSEEHTNLCPECFEREAIICFLCGEKMLYMRGYNLPPNGWICRICFSTKRHLSRRPETSTFLLDNLGFL